MDAPTDLSGLVETTGKSLIEKMRSVVSPKGKKSSWLRNLSDKRLAEIYQRLKMRQSPIKIAKHAQVEWGIMRKSDTVSISRAIYKFRSEMLSRDLLEFPNEPGTPLQEKNAMTRQRALSILGARGRRIEKKIDLLGTMQWVITEQAERIAALRQNEISAGTPLEITDMAMKNFGLLFSKLSETYFKLGLWDSKPSEYNLTIKSTMDEVFAKLIRNDGVPMIDATNKLIESIKGECLTASLNDDGSYELIPSTTNCDANSDGKERTDTTKQGD